MSGPSVPAAQAAPATYSYQAPAGADQGTQSAISNLQNTNYAAGSVPAFQGITNQLQNGGFGNSAATQSGQTLSQLSGNLSGASNAASGNSATATGQSNAAAGNVADPGLAQLAAAYGNGTAYNSAGVTGAGNGLLGLSGTLGAQVAPTLAQASSISPYISQALTAGFDPEQALYARTQQQNTDQNRANSAANGLGGTPYAAGVEGQLNSDFNLDWQDRALGRQATAAGTAGTLGGLETGLQGSAANLAGASGNAANSGAALVQSVPAAQLAALQAADTARNNALTAGAGAAGTYGGLAQGYSGQQGSLAGAAGSAAQAGTSESQAPANSILAALGLSNQAGAAANTNTQQVIQDWLAYLTGNTSAENAATNATDVTNKGALAAETQENTQNQQFLKDLGGATSTGLSFLGF